MRWLHAENKLGWTPQHIFVRCIVLQDRAATIVVENIKRKSLETVQLKIYAAILH